MIITFQTSIHDKEVSSREISVSQLLRSMRKMHLEPFDSKEGLGSFNLVEFDGEGKKEINMKSIYGQILDFDGCECDIQDVLDFFSQYTYVAYSSFNNGKKGIGSRFRLILPYSTPIENFPVESMKNVYEHVFDIFADDLKNLPTGLDTSKRNPGAFYLRPCNTEHNIFFINEAALLNWSELIETEKSQKLLKMKMDMLKIEEQRKKEREESRKKKQKLYQKPSQ